MSYIIETIEEIEKVNLKSEEAIDIIQGIISTRLRKLPIFMNDLIVGEPLIRSRYLKKKTSIIKFRITLTILNRNILKLVERTYKVNQYFMLLVFVLPHLQR
jgi:hypothetical protein